MTSTRSRRGALVAAISLMIAAATALVAATCASVPQYASKWDESHSPKDVLSGARPECPQHWGKVPLYPDSAAIKLFGVKKPDPTKPGLETEGDAVVFTTGAAWSATVPSGPIENVAGPNTNIPEFHDCQKFVNAEQTRFDSLFAIFVSYRMDRIFRALWDNVTWTSNDVTKATVANGKLTAIAVGTVTITATSVSDPSRMLDLTLSIVQDLQPSVPDTVIMSTTGTLTLGATQGVTLVAEIAKRTEQIHAAAAIYNYGPRYNALGITSNFSCLYLYFDSPDKLRAKIIPVADLAKAVDACFDAKDPRTDPGENLSVVRRPVRRNAKQAAVARWDWDSTYKQQYIGIACGRAWCEIGPSNLAFTPSAGHSAADGASLDAARVVENKGWYDEQNLAMPAPTTSTTSPGAQKLVPSGIIGTLIPDPALQLKDSSNYIKPWVPAAYIALDINHATARAIDHYWKKFNLRPAPVRSDLNSMNRLAYCFGTRKRCAVPPPTALLSASCGPDRSLFGWENAVVGRQIERWWVRITSAKFGDPPMYRCVIRRGHPEVKDTIPATARWRFILDDDTSWTECTQGCCETRIS